MFVRERNSTGENMIGIEIAATPHGHISLKPRLDCGGMPEFVTTIQGVKSIAEILKKTESATHFTQGLTGLTKEELVDIETRYPKGDVSWEKRPCTIVFSDNCKIDLIAGEVVAAIENTIHSLE